MEDVPESVISFEVRPLHAHAPTAAVGLLVLHVAEALLPPYDVLKTVISMCDRRFGIRIKFLDGTGEHVVMASCDAIMGTLVDRYQNKFERNTIKCIHAGKILCRGSEGNDKRIPSGLEDPNAFMVVMGNRKK